MKFLRLTDWTLFCLRFQVLGKNQHRKQPDKTPRNLLLILCLPQEIGFMKQLWLFFFPIFMSFTAPFVRESYHRRFNRETPQKAVLFHVLAAFRLVVLLHYELISSLWDDGARRFFFFAPRSLCIIGPVRHNRNPHPSALPRARAPLLRLLLSVWPHSRLTWLMGLHPCSAASESLLISSVYRLGSLPRACHGRVTLLDDRPTRFQAVARQSRWLVSTKHIKMELSHFTGGFYFCGKAFPVNPEQQQKPPCFFVVEVGFKLNFHLPQN